MGRPCGLPSERDPWESSGEAAIDNSSERISVPWAVSDMAAATAMVVGSFVVFLLLLAPLTSAVGDDRAGLAVPWLVAASESVLLLAVWTLAIKKYRVNWQMVGL